MAGTQDYWLLAAAPLAAAMLLASAAGASQAPPGPQATAKVAIRLSVRPAVRLDRAGPAGPLCLWSNLGPGDYRLRAHWSDGRTVDLPVPGADQQGCGGPSLRPSLRPILLEALGPGPSGAAAGRPVLLMIEAK